ncbi:MAG: helix-turn-helix transcriptional regulator [Planctomycetota bacterium]
MSERSLLECVVLGIVWKMGPITPYAIRQEFRTSPTPHFSGSAGAIYPAVRRLERDGLLASRAVRQGRRRGRQYRITKAGGAVLKSWLRPPLRPGDAGPSFDPLRTRLYFLAAVTPRQRRAFLDGAIAALEAQRPILEADEARYASVGDTFSRLASLGIRRDLETRIAWLKAVQRELQIYR